MVLRSIKLIIKSKLENVSLVGITVNKICSIIPFSKIDAYQTELCIVEACNNIIKYAYVNDPDGELEVDVKLCIDKIMFEICDTGQTMSTSISPTLEFNPEDLDEIPAGGMGLFIINKIMNNVNYKNNKGRNVLTLTKYYNSDKDN